MEYMAGGSVADLVIYFTLSQIHISIYKFYFLGWKKIVFFFFKFIQQIQPNQPLDEMSISCILRDLLLAIEYLHNEGKIHRDIKGQNLIMIHWLLFCNWIFSNEHFLTFNDNVCISLLLTAANILLNESGDVKVSLDAYYCYFY